MTFVFAHLISLVGFLLAIALVARAGEQRRPTGSLLAWLFAILLVPYIGVPMYLVFGGRKLSRRMAEKPPRASVVADAAAGPRAGLLCASGAAPPSRGNALELLDTGEVAFERIVELLRA